LKEKVLLYRKDFKNDSLILQKERLRLITKNLFRGLVRIKMENDTVLKHRYYWRYKNEKKQRGLPERTTIDENDFGYYFSKPIFDKN